MQSAGPGGVYQARQATLTTPGTGLQLSGVRGLNSVTYVFSASGATSCTLNVEVFSIGSQFHHSHENSLFH
jgi:hypothetical protein